MARQRVLHAPTFNIPRQTFVQRREADAVSAPGSVKLGHYRGRGVDQHRVDAVPRQQDDLVGGCVQSGVAREGTKEEKEKKLREPAKRGRRGVSAATPWRIFGAPGRGTAAVHRHVPPPF